MIPMRMRRKPCHNGLAQLAKVVREGGLDPATSQLLAGKFVCLYIDTDAASGRTLAESFAGTLAETALAEVSFAEAALVRVA